MRFAIGWDHADFDLKEEVKTFLGRDNRAGSGRRALRCWLLQ